MRIGILAKHMCAAACALYLVLHCVGLTFFLIVVLSAAAAPFCMYLVPNRRMAIVSIYCTGILPDLL